ncbi:MAG: hypothetical protein AAF438_08565 [Pseudomonadota bacterium]
MPRARKHLVCLNTTPYYHVVSRCVRRAFLCGKDRYSGKNYEHRRGWIENRLRVLSSLFSIELCAYAIMSNHYHLVVKVTKEADAWSDDEVLDRWTSLFRGPTLVQRHCAAETLSEVEQNTVRSMASVYRKRLGSLSWFMKCLNEPIARQANQEDGCTGHFWEARFRSQALCSEPALLAAMAYVDLNPIRAGVANTPESSAYTSVSRRLNPQDETTQLAKAISEMLDSGELRQFKTKVRPLLAFADEPKAEESNNKVLPIHRLEYLRLVDVAGRVISKGKRGTIDPHLAPILERLDLSEDEWLSASTRFKKHYRGGKIKVRTSA